MFVPGDPSVTVNGSAVKEAQLKLEGPGADVLGSEPIHLTVIKGAGRYAIRLKDNSSSQRTNAARLVWYPVQEDWRIIAKFVPNPVPTKITIDSIIGEQTQQESPGHVTFERNGVTYKLVATKKGKGLFFVIRDQTSGKTTYAASRFLATGEPKDGTVVLDFNKVENPPCALTAYATCPLPPPQNRLPLAVTAGEQKYPAGHH